MSTKKAVPSPLMPTMVSREDASQIVFGARLARSLIYTETPEDLIHLTAQQIWRGFEAYFAGAGSAVVGE